MNVVIIGSGGREHAMGWKLRQSPQCDRLIFAPGNAGTARIGTNVPISADKADQKTVDELAHLCRHEKIGLIVVGPEDPLSQGLVDKLQRSPIDVKVFGPTADAAQLEGNKAWCKKLMRGAAIPTAEYQQFTDARAALAYVAEHETPVVVKASGLAKGKGVIVCDNQAQAADAVRRVMVDREFDSAGDVVVIEERLTGQEVSILALVDGRNIFVLEPSQDHKQVGEGDTGANTGGMGAYTPTPLVDERSMREIERQVLVPTVDAMRREGITYRGVLYAGLMLTPGGLKVLEFNCRFGDPECQPILARMKGDLLAALLASCDGRLDEVDITWDRRVACCVVVCSGGYPGDYAKGLPIEGLDDAAAMDDVEIFHAGTKLDDGGQVLTNGGRVINVMALGADLIEAKEKANAAAAKIQFDGAFFRHDIGDRVLKVAAR